MDKQRLNTYFSKLQISGDEKVYIVVRLPAKAVMAAAGVVAEIAEPFSSVIVDRDEVSLVIPEEAFDDFRARLVGCEVGAITYRLITFDVVLPLNLVGFMAAVSSVLAEGGISIMAYAAFSRDHLLVPVDQYEQAITLLEQLKAGV
ncbi:MAG: ACT domain-containing protein [Anaerolineae bacterium]|nr:ACT domain-containing protein [Anaerolineae bacterium]